MAKNRIPVHFNISGSSFSKAEVRDLIERIGEETERLEYGGPRLQSMPTPVLPGLPLYVPGRKPKTRAAFVWALFMSILAASFYVGYIGV